MKNTFTTAWEFRVRPDSISEFKLRYGPEGDWVKLFRRSSGFIETLLLEDVNESGRYVTIDRWQSEEAYLAFRAEFEHGYIQLDRECDSLTLSEKHIGAFME